MFAATYTYTLVLLSGGVLHNNSSYRSYREQHRLALFEVVVGVTAAAARAKTYNLAAPADSSSRCYQGSDSDSQVTDATVAQQNNSKTGGGRGQWRGGLQCVCYSSCQGHTSRNDDFRTHLSDI